MVKNAAEDYAELEDWAKKNPKQFGYNGIKGGMSGVAFVAGWVYAFGGDADKLMKGPYDAAEKASWDKALAELKDFNKNVVDHARQCRHARHAQPRRDRHGPGLGRHVLFLAGRRQAAAEHEAEARRRPACPASRCTTRCPAKAAQAKLAEEFIALATSPEVQAEGIVKKFNWYPGIDAKHLEGKLDKAAWNKLFTDITPADLAKNGKPFPIAPYFNDILEAYEKKVAN